MEEDEVVEKPKASPYLAIIHEDHQTKEPSRYEFFMGYLQLTTIANVVFKYLGEKVIPRNNPKFKDRIAELYDKEDPTTVLVLMGEEDIDYSFTDHDKNILGVATLTALKPFFCQYDANFKISQNYDEADKKYSKLFISLSWENSKLIRDWVQDHLDDFFLREQWKPLKFRN